MVNGETYILGTEDKHLPHEAIPACPHLHDFLSWLSFHYSSRAVGCANKKQIVGVWILNFEKREWRPYKGGTESKKGKRKEKQGDHLFSTRFQN